MDPSSTPLNLVLVEDHDVLRGLLQQALQDDGHQVIALSCAEELEDVAGGQSIDLFLIDINLPGEDGLSLTERVRAAYPLAGLILISARSSLQDKLDGYARGADFYLTKPVEVPELCSAVWAFARRRHYQHRWLAQPEGFTLLQNMLSIRKMGQEPVALSAAEVAMLVAFSRAPGQRLAYWQIAEILGLNLETYAKGSLEVRVVRLRKKLVEAGADATCIESIRSHGYQLCIPLQVV